MGSRIAPDLATGTEIKARLKLIVNTLFFTILPVNSLEGIQAMM